MNQLRQVLAIAHYAGNRRNLLGAALAAGVDAVEADLRLDGDRLVARHERKPLPLPLFLDRWSVRWSSEPQVALDELLERLKGKASLFADLKTDSIRTVEVLLATLKRQGVIEGTRVSSTHWHLLKRIRETEPRLPLHYSIGDEEMLADFRRLLEDDSTASAVSINHTLVSEELAQEFRAKGIEIAAYHVGELSRAQDLVGWGVGGIITKNLDILRALKSEDSSETKPLA